MKLFRSQNANVSEGEGAPSPEQENIQHDWRATALRLVITAFVIAVVALAAAWALRSSQQTKPTHPKTPTSGQAAKGAKSAPSPAKQKAGQSGGAVSGKAQAPPRAASPPQPSAPPAKPAPAAGTATTQTGTAAGKLTNTGPGDVVTWFVITSTGATGLYYLVLLRRLRTE